MAEDNQFQSHDSDKIGSVVPSTGVHGSDWPKEHIITQGKAGSLSSAGWTEENEGFVQQTFLGASIRNFNINAGFGDTSSTLSVQLVNDEYNTSDGTGQGEGDDHYHGGVRDKFTPPVVGTPVYFKFGKNHATVEEAYRKTFDDLYGRSTFKGGDSEDTFTTTGEITSIPNGYHLRSSSGTGSSKKNIWVKKTTSKSARGKNHFVFGGILQSYTQNRGPGGNPAYSVQVTDPREILGNAIVLLNNYQGTTFNNKNLFNVYGFLEYDVSDALQSSLLTQSTQQNILTKLVDAAGTVYYVGDDTYQFGITPFGANVLPSVLPITGQGFSRRSDKGIPWYRVNQGLKALFNYDGFLPQEYVDAGFGGTIDFRGYKYVVDFSGIPLHLIPQMYFMDFDQLSIMDIAQELCDVISHDLYVTMLPVIDHPSCEFLYNYNKSQYESNPENIIAGIIRIDAIDKSKAPEYGAIKSYIDKLSENGIEVENQDVGFELSNNTTDKFIVGAQEVEMYYFNNNKDRDNLEFRKQKAGQPNRYELLQKDQWNLETSLKQQILPFYGFLGEKAVTIPRGFGAYKQIMLDTQGLNADGVGNYYIATEIELRHVLISFEAWKKFLLGYSELYIQELSENQGFFSGLARGQSKEIPGINTDVTDKFGGNVQKQLEFLKNRDYGVSVPRCVFDSDRNYMGADGYPASPCSPPYGYPLYYKRAQKIGILEGGASSIQTAISAIHSNIAALKKNREENADFVQVLEEDQRRAIRQARASITLIHSKLRKAYPEVTDPDERAKLYEQWVKPYHDAIKQAEDEIKQYSDKIKELDDKDLARIAAYKSTLNRNAKLVTNMPRYASKHLKNAQKVYSFLKQVAEENLGKKFLVKIPKNCNINYDQYISLRGNTSTNDIARGPFGFKPTPVNSNANYISSAGFTGQLNTMSALTMLSPYEHYLDPNTLAKYTYGALKCNFNPLSDKWEYNYKPEPQGGFFNFSLYNKNLSAAEAVNVPRAQTPPVTQQLLAPMDLTPLLTDGNRINCYVRYDHSELMDFSSIDKSSISQQGITANGFVPDVLEELDNLNPDKTLAFDQIQARLGNPNIEQRAASVAYVKCQVNEELYMPPKTITASRTVWARDFEANIVEPPFEFTQVENEDGCLVPSGIQRRIKPGFSVPVGGGSDGTSANNTDFVRYSEPNMGGDLIVETTPVNLDSNHVYAIITVPGRVVPSVDSRYLEGPLQAFHSTSISNILTRDVVKGVEGFDKPAAITNGKMTVDCEGTNIDFKKISEALHLQKKMTQQAAFSEPSMSAFESSPSPVYPDMVAMPLMSMERCYGPWLSASVVDQAADPRVRYSDIGGKIEFVKKETLAPWNFAGYQLMNEAGSLEAQFSNSLLLFSERGGFVYPDAPTGIALAKELQNKGPLITSISVDVSNSIKTTVKLDLYTSRFGKLQKQKEGAIATIARERQKIIDQNNNAIRRGLGKAAGNNDLMGGLLRNGGAEIIAASRTTANLGQERNQERAKNMLIWSSIPEHTVGSGSPETSIQNFQIQGSILDPDQVEQNMASFSDEQALNKQYLESAGGNLEDIFTPISNDVYSYVFPQARYNNEDAKNRRLN